MRLEALPIVRRWSTDDRPAVQALKIWRARPAFVPPNRIANFGAHGGLPAVARISFSRAKAGAPGRN
jgi:hypothetical protein